MYTHNTTMIPCNIGNANNTWSNSGQHPKELDVFRAAVYEAQILVKAPLAMALSSALMAATLPVQSLFDVKQPTGIVSPTSLFVFVSADSGDRKSTMDRLFFKVVHDFEKNQRRLMEQFEDDIAIAELISEERKRNLKSALRSAIRNEDVEALDNVKNQYLKLQQEESSSAAHRSEYLIENITPMALVQKFATGFNSGILHSSEGGVILDDKFHEILPLLNKAWDGESIKISRVRGGDLSIHDPRLSMMIMIQSGIFQRFIRRQKNLAKTSGFLARCLTIQPISTQGSRFVSMHEIMDTRPTPALDAFNRRLEALLSEERNSNGERTILEFTPMAKKIWMDFFNLVESELKSDGQLDSIRDFASKISNNVARIAAILHVFCGCEGDINEGITSYAINLGYAFLAEFNCIFHIKTEEMIAKDAAFDLYQWLIKRYAWGSPPISTAAILRLGPSSCRKKDNRDRAMDILYQYGLVDFIPDNFGFVRGIVLKSAQFGQETSCAHLSTKITPPNWGAYI